MKPANMPPGEKTTAPQASDMGWSSYIVPVAGSVIVSCLAFFLGKFNYSILWLGIIVVLNIVRSYLWKKRESRLLALRSTATREREVILAQLQDLPAWVQFPDTERVEWMNKVILQLWPYVGEYAKVFMTDFIIPQVKAQMPGMFKNFKFTKMDMGDLPCRVGGIKVYTHNVGRDRIIVDMEVAYAGDADFSVACCGFSGGMNNIVFSGKLRCVLKPLLPYPPMVGGISASFLEMPKIDFNLTGMGEFVELPGLMNAIRSVINSQVAAIAVLPNEIVVPLAPDVDVTKLFFPEPDGVIRLKIIEAKQLENKDISFVRKGKSDPYCEIQVGSQFMKTRTIDNDLNPVWNEYFEAVVDQADGQKLRIELFDEDQGQDEELGRLSLDLSMIRSRGSLDRWFPLEGCKHGDLHIKATWMSLSTDLKYLDMRGAYEWLQADKPIHPALVMIFVDSVSELPYPKSKLEPSPYVEVTLGKESQRTPVKVKTVNPLYQTKFLFFVRNPEGQDLKLEAIDDGTKRGLGSLTIPLSQLMKEPELENYQTTFMLTHGVHQSPIVITCRLRVMAPTETYPEPNEPAKITVDETLLRKDCNGLGSIRQRKTLAQGVRDQNVHLDNDILKEYGNASHIERANSKTNGKVGNGDAHAVEPSKTVNPHAGVLDPENKLTVDSFNILRSDSNISLNSGTQSGRSSRLGRIFKSKHEKDSRSRAEIPRGDVEMAIRYADATGKLVVLILKARQLLPFDKKGACSPYTTVKLLDAKTGKEVAKRKTATIKNSLNPIYDNHFEFDVNASDLHNYKIQIDVKDDTNYGAFSSKPVVGTVGIRLEQLHDHELPQQWVPLQAERR